MRLWQLSYDHIKKWIGPKKWCSIAFHLEANCISFFSFSFNLQSLLYIASINIELKQLELYKNLINEEHRLGTRYKLKKVCTSLANKYQNSEFAKVIVLALKRFISEALPDFGSFFLQPKNNRKKIRWNCCITLGFFSQICIK